ncbi:MAG: preprotein translocase subunit YajC [Clostridia bacterium]|nr:preprotein translocase subunit YajC [Clostridia bacterium]
MDTQGLILWVVIMAAFFYFFVYRPQKKQEKAARILRNSLTPGDMIETIGGFTGRVIGIKDDEVTFETGANRTKLVVKKWGIRSRTPAEDAAAIEASAEEESK